MNKLPILVELDDLYNVICMEIAHWLPTRVVYWAGIRMHSAAWRAEGNKTPEEIDIFKQMEMWRKE